MNNKLDFFAEPYAARRVSLFFGWYEVVFEEDTVIIGVRGKQTAERIAAAFNGAYNLGRSFELIRQEISEMPENNQ